MASSSSSHHHQPHHDDEDGGGGEPSSSELSGPVDNNEYYQFLHVSPSCPASDIVAAYKRLSRLYHPDKHVDEERKQQAEMLFNKLQTVYQVLSDPHKRAIYDCLGKKGLEEDGWTIVQRTKTPGEIREEYERLAKERDEHRLQQRTNPTSRVEVMVNATDLFERYLYDDDLSDEMDSALPSLEVTAIKFGQTIDCPLTNADNVQLLGRAGADRGKGHGSVGCQWRHVSSANSWQECSLSVGHGQSGPGAAAVAMFRRLNLRTTLTMSGSMQFTPRGLKPSFSASLQNNLGKRTTGYLTFGSGWRVDNDEHEDVFSLSQEDSSMCTTIAHHTDHYNFVASLQFGLPFTYLSLIAVKKFDEAMENNKARASVQLGTFGAALEYGLERKVSSHSTLGAKMVVGIPFGVTLKIKLTRAKQTYLFPIHLSDEILLQPIFYGTVVPLLAYYTVKKLVLDPFEQRKKKEEKQKEMEANKERVAKSRKEASASIDLMRQRFYRIRSDELAKGGLVIIAAFYGKIYTPDSREIQPHLLDFLESPTSRSPDYDALDSEFVAHTQQQLSAADEPLFSAVQDVTIPVQCLVEEPSRLTLYEGSKADLSGFFDPCLAEDKQLLVRYLYQQRLHQVVVIDEDVLKLPKNAHYLST